MKYCSLGFLFVFVVLSVSGSSVVEIGDGPLRGKTMTTKTGRDFDAFLGIPYAKPPVGDLRFEPPVPPDPWEDTLDATQIHPVCPQRDIYRRVDLFEGDEDCLYLNVYTPNLNSSKGLLPVMVFLHGGGWLCGSGNVQFYGPDLLLDKDIVLVVPNYRLGALGFLSTGDLLVPGNNGLKDQVAALKWVQKNIEAFGGDPGSVTVFGESAGGAATHYHTISPLSKGLLHRGIAQSGTAFVPWGLAPHKEGIEHSRRLAKILHCPTGPSDKMIACLRKIKDPLKFVKKDVDFMFWDFDPMIPFKPVIEPPHPGAFLTEHPADIIRSGKSPSVPLITGINTDDGALRAAGIFGNPHLVDELDQDFHRVAPISLLYDKTAHNVDFVSDKIREFYFGDRTIDFSTVQEVVDMYTDAWFLTGADDAVRLHKAYLKSPIYYYLFGHKGAVSFTRIFGDPHNDYGVCHGDDLQYLFPISDGLWPHEKPNEKDLQMTEILTTLWTNFAKFGNPTPNVTNNSEELWEPVSTQELEYYYIGGPGNLRMDKGMFSKRAEFWRELPVHYRKNIVRDEL